LGVCRGGWSFRFDLVYWQVRCKQQGTHCRMWHRSLLGVYQLTSADDVGNSESHESARKAKRLDDRREESVSPLCEFRGVAGLYLSSRRRSQASVKKLTGADYTHRRRLGWEIGFPEYTQGDGECPASGRWRRLGSCEFQAQRWVQYPPVHQVSFIETWRDRKKTDDQACRNPLWVS
jgi:hypothetical protein